jgi:hypothetical protein
VIDLFFKKKSFALNKGENGMMSLVCEGYSTEDIITFLNLVNGAEAARDPKELELDEETLKKIVESKGDLHEFVSTEGKDVEVVEVGKPKLPNCTTNFTCPHCRQSILLYNNNRTLVRDCKTKKLYDIGEAKFPSMRADDETNMNLLIAVYKDCLEMISEDSSFVLVSDSPEACECPVCGHTGSVKEFVTYHEYNYNDGQTCDICGCEKDNVISQEGENFDCVNHCLEKLGELFEEDK